ncbi:MAG: biotin--[acetyl-CoA-carboxylase] ligase [Burkholderiaceae bacterium]
MPLLIDAGRLRQACLLALGAGGADGAVIAAPAVDGAVPAVDPDQWCVVDEIGSTNQELMAMPFGDDGPAPPRLLVAWRQLAGRGRRGRAWSSPPQVSLTFSIAFERVAPPMPPVGWPIAAGVGIAEALLGWVSDIGLKWPNDLQRQGRKCGGILAETRRQAGAPALERVVTGIGLNLLPDPQRDALAGQPAIGLFDEALPVSREDVVARVFGGLWRQWRIFADDGFGDHAARWAPFDTLRGREVAVIDNGRTLYTGMADGIDETGALRVVDDGHVRTVTVGDVSVRRIA